MILTGAKIFGPCGPAQLEFRTDGAIGRPSGGKNDGPAAGPGGRVRANGVGPDHFYTG